MAAENLKSQSITDMTASPKVLVDAHVQGGVVREATGVVTPAAAAEANSTYRFCRVPSNARVSQVLINNAAFTTAGAVNIGLYDIDGGSVVDADLFGSAVALTAAKQNADVTFESGEYTIAESEKPLWEVLGLSSDPGKDYDVAYTVSTAFDGGSIMGLSIRYVV